MKLVILADIHGNIEALQSILRRETDADLVVCAGDLVDCGPFPEEVIACVRDRGIRSVRGNHDRKAIQEFRSGDVWEEPPEGEITFTRYCARRLCEEDIRFLESLPEALEFEADGHVYGVRHEFSGYRPVAASDEFEERWAAHFQATDLPRRMVFAHMHRRYVQDLSGGRLALNPGAVSFNRPDVPGTRYVTVIDGKISWEEHAYDKARIVKAFRAIGNLRKAERDWLLQFYPFRAD